MLREDFAIQSNVRRILVRSNIDYSKISFGTVRGIVYFRGIFLLGRMHFRRDEKGDYDFRIRDITVKSLSSLEKKIRSLPGVVDVTFQFTNWKKEMGQWVPTEELKRKQVQEGGRVGETDSSV